MTRRRYTCPPYDERCTASVQLSSGGDLCVCMRRRVAGSQFCRQHAKTQGTKPHPTKKHRRI